MSLKKHKYKPKYDVMEIAIEGWEEFTNKWAGILCHGKYLSYQPQIDKFYTLSKSLGLEGIRPMRTLDISSGMGFFPLVLKKLGHSVFATNPLLIKWTEIYIEGQKLLGLPELINHEMERDHFVPLPKTIGKFDFISAIAVSPMSRWSIELWKMFINDCASHLNKNGRILISPNRIGRINLANAFPEIESKTVPRLEYWLLDYKYIKGLSS